jgi:hypothetical protein
LGLKFGDDFQNHTDGKDLWYTLDHQFQKGKASCLIAPVAYTAAK